jgi:hypothetical protein
VGDQDKHVRWPAALRGYGPLIAMSIAFLLMVALVPSQTPTAAGASAGPGDVKENEQASGGDQVKPCAGGRKDQVPGDPYSPPCLEWTGTDNGGETSRGVTADKIVISARQSSGGADLLTTMQKLLPGAPTAPPGATADKTLAGLVEYFNKNFQFYGRKLEIRSFAAKTDPTAELTGAGQQQAEADAVTAATEIEAFADISATTEPYNAALAAKKVIALGAPYMSDTYFQERRPYAWSYTPSCSVVSKATSEAQVKTLAGKPAKYAGDPALRTRTRKVAIVSPDNKEYQTCTKEGVDYLRAHGTDAVTLSYPLDLANVSKAAENLLNKLQAEGITSVACACDPLLPKFLTEAATKANYRPEWLVMGTALTDSDTLGALYDKEQWAHAFGVTALGQQFALNESPAYKAFKTVRPNEEPVPSIEVIYYELYLLAIGVQMAGPDLKPENFEKGMFAYPEHSGPGGTWKFGGGNYTPQTSASIVWWDAQADSAVTKLKGTYKRAGELYRIGEMPSTEPEVFKR